MSKVSIRNKTRSSRRLSSSYSRSSTVQKNRSRYKLKKGRSGGLKGFFNNLKKKKAYKILLRVTLVIFSVLFIFGVLAGAYIFNWVQGLNEEVSALADNPLGGESVIPTVIVDRNGEQLYKVIGDINSDEVNIEMLSPEVKWAFLATEDVRFYDHSGLDTRGIIRCGIENVLSGSTTCGGSTITQQLLKNGVLATENSRVERKVKEILMAPQVEDFYTKDEILEMYLSAISFGSNVVGIETAAQYYFRVDAKDLTVAQAAILASIINNPASLSPTKPFDGDLARAQEAVKSRQENVVLASIMNNLDYINDKHREQINDEDAPDLFTKDSIEVAINEELNYATPVATDKKAGHFVDYVLNELTTKNYKNGEEPFTSAELQSNNYTIYTSLDYQQQQIAERYAAAGGNEYNYWNVNNAGLLTVDARNGQILAMAGSKNYYGESTGCNANGTECLFDPQVNVLTSLNEPGSTAKVLGYTEAFDQGKLFGGSNIPDIPISYGEIGYFPKNWDGGYKGHVMTVRDALVQSRNITALEVIELIGIDNYFQRSLDLGYTTIQRDLIGPSIILGGASVRYTEHAAAFTPYANEGVYSELVSILKIEDRDGNVIYESSTDQKEVFSPQAVYLTNDILYNLQNISNQAGVPLYSKTGTTENNIEALQVAWNSNQVTLGWAGNNNNSPLDPFYGYPIYVVQPWMAAYIGEISNSPYYVDKNPSISVPGFISRGGGCNEKECNGIASDWLISDKIPPSSVTLETAEVCADDETKLAREIDIITGNSVTRTFQKFEMPVERFKDDFEAYLEAQGIVNGAPTEYCESDSSGEAVSSDVILINSPIAGQVISGDSVELSGAILKPEVGASAITFKLEGQTLATITSDFEDFSTKATINRSQLIDGNYQMIVEIVTIIGTRLNLTIPVVIGSDGLTQFNFVDLPASIQENTNTSIRLNYSGGATPNSVSLYQIKNGGTPTLVGRMNSNTGGFEINWGQNQAPGTYAFYAVVSVGQTGTIQTATSSQITIDTAQPVQ